MDKTEFLQSLQQRFDENLHRHAEMEWADVLARLEKHPEKLNALMAMEETGGEPDVIGISVKSGEFLFVDCSKETPKGRRSICYDPAALAARKTHKPAHSAVGMAAEMGVRLLSESLYQQLQELEEFDLKTSSWLDTPEDIRTRGGALFGDRRFGRVFTYHNGAESYYGVRGFRAVLEV